MRTQAVDCANAWGRELTIRDSMTQAGESDGLHGDGEGISSASVHGISERSAPDGVVLLGLHGEFDLAAAPAARERLEQVRAQRPRGVVLDMAEVTFADSSGLRELLHADAALRGDGSRLIIAAPPPAVERLLTVTRASDLLELAPTVEQALKQLAELS
jgi:anti-sigma B factor antagonist